MPGGISSGEEKHAVDQNPGTKSRRDFGTNTTLALALRPNPSRHWRVNDVPASAGEDVCA